jgi:hypothetical protein
MQGRLQLHPATLDELRARLGADHPALGFATAVTAHLALRPEIPGNDRNRERDVAARVAGILQGIERASHGAPVAALDVELAASFFQNADLLEPGGMHANGIAGLLHDRLAGGTDT